MIKRDTISTAKAWGIRLAAVALSLIVAGLVIVAITKQNPIQVYLGIIDGAVGSSRRVWVTIRETLVLLCIAIGLTPAFKMKFWNIGAEGQILMGGMATAALMIYAGDAMPNWLLLILIFIASATAKGLGLALNKPLIHVPTLDATAYNLFGASGLICPIMDARRNQVYTGIYRFEREFETVMDQDAMDMGELIGKLNGMGERVIFLGDGVPVYEKQIAEKMTVPYDLAPAHVNRQRAASVAALGAVYFAEGKTETAMEHKPDYLRKSQAEREREEREAKNA